MAIETIPFDPARYLASAKAQIDLIEDAFQSGDPRHVAAALRVVARARGMADVAAKAGLSGEGLDRLLDDGADPTLSTLLDLIRALGIRLHVEPASAV